MPLSSRRIGILAGGGSIPHEIAASLAARRVPLFVVALDGESDRPFEPHPSATVNWGRIGRMVSLFRAAGTTDIVIVGRVSRPDLTRVRPDLGLVRALPMILRIVRAGGDDAVLREVIAFFEGKGFRVVGPGDVAPELVLGAGPLGTARADAADRADIALGLEVVARLGPLDIGQGVVVRGGRIAAIEGVEGTDRMLGRVAAIGRAAGGSGSVGAAAPQVSHPAGGMAHGVLIKRPKPGQELRIDLPAIGPETVTRAAEAGLKGIAVLAGRTIAAERAELVRRADALRLFVEGIPEAEPPPPVAAESWPATLEMLEGRRPPPATLSSAVKGARVVAALVPYGVGLAAVVVRRHVLAVEADEGALALVARVGELRQWGLSRGRRRGVVVLSSGAATGPRVVEAAAGAGLEGLVVLGRNGGRVSAETLGAARRHGLFVAAALSAEARHVEVD